MPGEVIDQPNPPPLPSQLPDVASELLAKVPRAELSEEKLRSVKEFQRAACYIAACKFVASLETVCD
jgi:xylulose-5-phosphate/fructose-6-phosphate phosphoketolase